jgi:hypothetical protein
MMKYLENMEKRMSYHLALNFTLNYIKIEKIIWKMTSLISSFLIYST